MTITTAQSISGALWNLGSYAGTLTVNRDLAPQQTVSPSGSTTSVNGVNPSSLNVATAGGISYVTAGFDPIAVYSLQVLLRSTGQIWPVGYS